MLWLSPSVCGDLNREAANARRVIEREAAKLGEDVYVTHQRDGRHTPGSRHYQGDAFDLLKLKKATVAYVVEWLQKSLGAGMFDVVEETDHWHVEFDPK